MGKEFVAGEMPTPQEICKKQLYKVMDQIVKTDVDEEQIGPFMQDISRYFEFIDKEDLIKKIVSVEFGKFLLTMLTRPKYALRQARRSEARGRKTARSAARVAVDRQRKDTADCSLTSERRMVSILAR